MEHEKQVEQAMEEKKKVEREKASLSEEMERLKEEARGMPKREELEKYVHACTCEAETLLTPQHAIPT